MNICEALRTRRTARRFKKVSVPEEKLIEMIDCARLSPSGANLQSLKYAVILSEDARKAIYPYVTYAGYIPEWNPEFSETPAAFIAVLNDADIRPNNAATQCDSGIAMMSITLAALEMGYDSCMLGAIKREEIMKSLEIDGNFELLYLIGIGVSDGENSYYDSNEEVKYRMDEEKNFVVPKRGLKDVMIKDKSL